MLMLVEVEVMAYAVVLRLVEALMMNYKLMTVINLSNNLN